MANYKRLKAVPLWEVLPLLGNPIKQKPVERVNVSGTLVNVQGLRLATFKHKGLVCATCGVKGEFFAIEKGMHDKGEIYHLNLYGVDPTTGLDVLMTHDHILARSLGGANDLSNAQTMCSPCNSKKSIGENPKHGKKHSTPVTLNSNPYFEYGKDFDSNPMYLHLRMKPMKNLEMA